MRATQNPILYVLAHDGARRLLHHLQNNAAIPYEEARKDLALDAETFHRITRKLAQFDLLRLRGVKKGEFKGGRVKLAVTASPSTDQFLRGLTHLDRAMWKHRDLLGERSVTALQGSG